MTYIAAMWARTAKLCHLSPELDQPRCTSRHYAPLRTLPTDHHARINEREHRPKKRSSQRNGRNARNKETTKREIRVREGPPSTKHRRSFVGATLRRRWIQRNSLTSLPPPSDDRRVKALVPSRVSDKRRDQRWYRQPFDSTR